MVNLEYLIIYEDSGLPVYSRCFGSQCKRSMSNDVLFSAFLSALNTFAALKQDRFPDEMELEGEMIKVNYNDEKRVNTIELTDLELIFYYTRLENITIAAGITLKDSKIWQGNNMFDILLGEVESFMGGYKGYNWSNVSTHTLLEFEVNLLDSVIMPFFDKFDMKNKCGMGDNCPYRLAMYEGKGVSIYDKLGHKVREIAKSSMMRKMWLMMMPSKYKLKRSKA